MITFATVETTVRTLNEKFAANEIDAATFESQLLDLIDVGPDGAYWMFGHDSEQWFRYDGTRWVAATPSTVTPNGGVPWQTIDVSWFIASVVIIAAIGGVVYASV